jgi:lipopolysaccharide biosynthesis glycosyltransferase
VADYAPRVIVSSSDEKYSPGLIVALASMLRHMPPGFEVDVVIYDEGLLPGTLEQLRMVVARSPTTSRLHFEEGFSRFGDLPVVGHVNQAMYSRLLIPQLSPDIKRAVHFDADMLGVGDISELLTMDLGDAILAACVDTNTPTLATGVAYSYEALGLPAARQYFNTGLLVIDVDAWRRADVCGRTIDYVRHWSDVLRCPDQDGINVVAGERGLALDGRFNFQVSGEALAAVARGEATGTRRKLQRAAALHFTGPKPWLQVWFGSRIWGRSAARWWSFALGSSLIPFRTRVGLAQTGAETLAREIRRRLVSNRSATGSEPRSSDSEPEALDDLREGE